MRRIFGLMVLLWCFGTSTALANDDPRQVVEQASQALLAALQENYASLQEDSSQINALISSILLPHFDFQRMSQWVMGRHWRQADASQREAFVSSFRDLLITTYGKALLDYTDETLSFSDATISGGNDATVRSEVSQSSGSPIPIHYRLHNRDGGWKVYDVSVEGVSLVTNYRSQIDSLINQQGIDGMIQKLTEGDVAQ